MINFLIDLTNSPKEKINAANSPYALKENVNTPMKVDQILVYTKSDDTDETVKAQKIASVHDTVTGKWYGTISTTAIETIEMISDMISDTFAESMKSEPVEIIAKTRKSKSDRDYMTIELL